MGGVKRVGRAPQAFSRGSSYVGGYAPSFSRRLPMGLLHTTAADLPHFVLAHAKVMAMVVRAQSAAGARLRPVFEQFATNHAYASITFVWLPAADATPADPLWAAPFFCTFAQGKLVSDTLSTEQQVRGVLHALHAHG